MLRKTLVLALLLVSVNFSARSQIVVEEIATFFSRLFSREASVETSIIAKYAVENTVTRSAAYNAAEGVVVSDLSKIHTAVPYNSGPYYSMDGNVYYGNNFKIDSRKTYSPQELVALLDRYGISSGNTKAGAVKFSVTMNDPASVFKSIHTNVYHYLPDLQTVNKSLKGVYLNSNSAFDYKTSEMHLKFLKANKIISQKLLGEKPFCIFCVHDGVLYISYSEGNRNLSSYIKVSDKGVSKLIERYSELSKANALNMVCGDNKKISEQIQAALDKAGKDFYVRGADAKFGTSMLEHISRLQTLQERGISLDNLSFVNGLPQDLNSMAAMDFNTSDIAAIDNLHQQTETWFAGASKKIYNRDGFIDELQHGNSDVMFAFFHATENTIYINNEKMTLDEFAQLQKREQRSSKPRVIILLACRTGNLFAKEGFIFTKSIKSFGQLMVEKNFADLVLAPDCDISDVETKDFAEMLLKGATINTLRLASKGKMTPTGFRFDLHNKTVQVFMSDRLLNGQQNS